MKELQVFDKALFLFSKEKLIHVSYKDSLMLFSMNIKTLATEMKILSAIVARRNRVHMKGMTGICMINRRRNINDAKSTHSINQSMIIEPFNDIFQRSVATLSTEGDIVIGKSKRRVGCSVNKIYENIAMECIHIKIWCGVLCVLAG